MTRSASEAGSAAVLRAFWVWATLSAEGPSENAYTIAANGRTDATGMTQGLRLQLIAPVT